MSPRAVEEPGPRAGTAEKLDRLHRHQAQSEAALELEGAGVGEDGFYL